MISANLKTQLAAWRNASTSTAFDAMAALFDPDARIHMCHPFGDLIGAEGLYEACYAPLLTAVPDLERRDMIVIAGTTPEGQDWVGCMGNFMGTFSAPFLAIPPTGHLVHMRYHEFFRFEDNRITAMQAIWDLPELMMQAKVWPMAPQLGAFLCTPSPMSGDGLAVAGHGHTAYDRVTAMITNLCRHPLDPDPRVMQLDRFWHPQFNWYGPAGIGTARGIAGFRHWHQIPFLRGMPDRKLGAMGKLSCHWLAEGAYVGTTGWPNMRLTLKGDGWLGLPPIGQEILLRSLDFWRVEDDLIRENWVLIDLLHLYHQLGIDVFGRLAEFNKARPLVPIILPESMTA